MSGQTNNIAGAVSFQSNDKMDVFQVLQVMNNGIQASDESLLKIDDPQFESERIWITGYTPKLIPVDVDGDTTVIHAWFKAENFDKSFTLRIYIEFEETEQVIASENRCENREQPKVIFL